MRGFAPKRLIARAKQEKKQTDETTARTETNFTGSVIGQPEVNVWLVEPINHASAASQVESDPLAVAIHAVEILSRNDRADFDRWYLDARQVVPAREGIGGNILLRDDPDQLTLALEYAPEQAGVEFGERDDREKSSTTPERVPEPDVVEVEDDPIIAVWLDLKLNSQKGGREWVLRGAPAVVPWEEHHIITDRLKPWREAYNIATPERQEGIRRWLEVQRL